ncbi:alpha/beta-type small acid-soluble spore protein [Paenibacillus sp. MWE-103]|uniref:Alpha/beta-type small acid-soluble spore protein n=1 Tax=Paenibacillus artemisiicola TaxID=1172618 RepID=A0ABS3WIF3_9BACL|nr:MULTISPECIES: alpha/beta-type small acid-soluble spore protein [Paenibacillus]MBO7748033.1 alpha/beta-type small acid-soluble spore protein [Paenibacillus artemisiicola]SFJ26540.1 Small, acid-soluble spore protein, alpha/beta type [Paenibacillus sp. UNC496MF]
MSRSNRKLVPECAQALDQMKYELAAELGLMTGGAGGADTEFASELGGTSGAGGAHVNWSQIATRDAGYIGGNITRRLVQQAEKVLNGL